MPNAVGPGSDTPIVMVWAGARLSGTLDATWQKSATD